MTEDPHPRREQLVAESREAMERARRVVADRRGRGPEPGDVFVLRETADLPVEWAVLARHPENATLVFAVPADTCPLVGAADLAVPRQAGAGALVLRCAFGAWVDRSAFQPERRTAVLDADTVERARRRVQEAKLPDEAGERGEQGDDEEAEYLAWVRDVLAPARAALARPEPVRGAARPMLPAFAPAPPWRGPASWPWVLAAAALLTLSLGLSGALVFQGKQIRELTAGNERTTAVLRRDLEQSAQEKSRLERERLRQAEEARRLGDTERALREKIVELERQAAARSREGLLVNPPLVWLNTETLRGESKTEELPADAPLAVLFLHLPEAEDFPEYRLEVLRAASGEQVLELSFPRGESLDEIVMTVPGGLLAPGDYRLRLYGVRAGEQRQVAEYDVTVGPG